MEPKESVLPHAVVGLLMILVAGAIALSLVTAPPVAKEQVQVAAANTLASPSFVVDDSSLVTASGNATQEHYGARIVYQTPDKVLETITGSSGVISELVIGTKHYERAGAGKWVQLPAVAQARETPGQEAVDEVLLPLRSLTDSSAAARQGNVYVLVPGRLDELLSTFGLPAQVTKSGSVSFAATVSGEFISSVRIVAVLGGEEASIVLFYRSIGTAPPITAPPASAVTLAPPGTTPSG